LAYVLSCGGNCANTKSKAVQKAVTVLLYCLQWGLLLMYCLVWETVQVQSQRQYKRENDVTVLWVVLHK
jgi:hypothetical protein